jgi:branched-chain amino acid aminotransferase, group II
MQNGTLPGIEWIPAREAKPKPPADRLGFGRHYTDHMFVMDYEEGRGWHSPRIVPYQPITLEPSAMVLHYAQTVFEGLKAFRTADGRIRLFRPELNVKRLNRSCVRLSIPPVDERLALEAIRKLVETDSDWVPEAEGTSLYIRPFIIATEPHVGVAPSATYQFLIIMTPVGAYYAEGIRPVSIMVETRDVRAVPGGIGDAKTGGNYAASLRAQQEAKKFGSTQVLWLDGVHRRYVEEVGSMNVFFKIGGSVVTPELGGSILDGVTRNSVLKLLQHWGVKAEERRISIDEIEEAHRAGRLEEAFGTGTAAVVSPIGELVRDGRKFAINGGEIGPLTAKLYETLTGIQYGRIEDLFGWMMDIRERRG